MLDLNKKKKLVRFYKNEHSSQQYHIAFARLIFSAASHINNYSIVILIAPILLSARFQLENFHSYFEFPSVIFNKAIFQISFLSK